MDCYSQCTIVQQPIPPIMHYHALVTLLHSICSLMASFNDFELQHNKKLIIGDIYANLPAAFNLNPGGIIAVQVFLPSIPSIILMFLQMSYNNIYDDNEIGSIPFIYTQNSSNDYINAKYNIRLILFVIFYVNLYGIVVTTILAIKPAVSTIFCSLLNQTANFSI